MLFKLPTAVFNTAQGMKMLKEEVKLFNKAIKLVTESVWLLTEKNRQNKMYFSAIISLATQEEVQKALRTQIVIAGTTVHAVKYTDNKSHNQCLKCQGFEHTHQKCINVTTCQICTEKHNIRDHTCYIYKKEQEICEHTLLKCSNCNEAHKVNISECAVFKALKSHSSSIDSLAINKKWVVQHTHS